MREKRASKDSGVAGIARAWAVALDFVFSVLAGAGVGWLFDRWRGTMPWGLLVGLALGFVVGFLRIVRTTQAQEREEAERKAGRKG
jgi:ATP synthase protein I